MYSSNLKTSKDKDDKILHLEKMIAESNAKIFRYESIIDALTANK